MVVNKNDGQKRIIIICNDRIERVVTLSMNNAMKAKDIERMAYSNALRGLRNARNAIANDPNMKDNERKEALDGIDSSIKDMEADLAKPD
jgi:uncharacterized protein YbaA (DUF1428 family)